MVKHSFRIMLCAFILPVLQATEYDLSINSSLKQIKCPTASLSNVTDRELRVGVTYLYHLPKDDDNIPTCSYLPEGVAHIPSPQEDVCLNVTGTPSKQSFVLLNKNGGQHSAQVLYQELTMASKQCILIGDMENVHILGISIKGDGRALFSFGIQEGRLSFQISDDVLYPYPATVFRHNFAGSIASSKIKVPFVVTTPIEGLLKALLDFYTREGAPLDQIAARFQAANNSGSDRLMLLRQSGVSKADPLIPLITHTLLTKKRASGSKLLSDQHIKWYAKTIKSLPTEFGWKHILWTDEDPSSLTKADLGSLWGKVEVRGLDSLSALPKAAHFLGSAKALMDQGFFGHASNLYKYFILYHLGGLTRGLDTEVTQPLTAFHKLFGLYASMNVNTDRMLASGFMAARPGHPALMQALMMAHLNTSGRSKPTHMFEGLCDYYLGSANALWTVAVYRCVDIQSDMIFGPQVLNPLRPDAQCTSSEHASFTLSPATHGVHFADVAWKTEAEWSKK